MANFWKIVDSRLTSLASEPGVSTAFGPVTCPPRIRAIRIQSFTPSRNASRAVLAIVFQSTGSTSPEQFPPTH